MWSNLLVDKCLFALLNLYSVSFFPVFKHITGGLGVICGCNYSFHEQGI